MSSDVNKLSHMVFLVLDHNQPNPLFRAPIGDSPKVNLYQSDYRLNVPLISQLEYSGHRNWSRELGNVIQRVTRLKRTSNKSSVMLPISIRQVLDFLTRPLLFLH